MAGWLTKQGIGVYRLPSEAEWEYACRAGEISSRYWGNESEEACFFENIFDLESAEGFEDALKGISHNCYDGYATTSPVGEFDPNAFGLHDMIGNVSEWCEDMDSGDNYSRHTLNNPVVLDGGEDRVLRGGNWASQPVSARSADRQHMKQEESANSAGFRLVKIY